VGCGSTPASTAPPTTPAVSPADVEAALPTAAISQAEADSTSPVNPTETTPFILKVENEINSDNELADGVPLIDLNQPGPSGISNYPDTVYDPVAVSSDRDHNSGGFSALFPLTSLVTKILTVQVTMTLPTTARLRLLLMTAGTTGLTKNSWTLQRINRTQLSRRRLSLPVRRPIARKHIFLFIC